MTAPDKTHRYLVYSSVGDNANIQCWLEDRNFDLWLTYYGDDNSVDLSEKCEYFLHKKGAKFPNFFYLFREFEHIVEQYEGVMIADDDLIMSGEDINSLFSLMQEHNLSLAQPSFNVCGKVSHPATRMRALSKLHFTSFVEVACPIFKTQYLLDFMKEYDDIVIGWGADWWFSYLVEKRDGRGTSIAVIDQVSCLNPLDVTKNQGREIDRFQSKDKRKEIWAGVKKERGLDLVEEVVQYKVIPSYSMVLFARYLKMRAKWLVMRLSSRLLPGKVNQ